MEEFGFEIANLSANAGYLLAVRASPNKHPSKTKAAIESENKRIIFKVLKFTDLPIFK